VNGRVYKATPEEQALMSNIAALVDEYQAMISAGIGAGPQAVQAGAQPGELGQGAGEEAVGTKDVRGNAMGGAGRMNGGDLNPGDGRAQSTITPEGNKPPKGTPKPPRDEDNTAIAKAITGAVMKALSRVRKEDIPFDAHVENNGLPFQGKGYSQDPAEEGDDPVAKAIAAAVMKAVAATDNDGSHASDDAEHRIEHELPMDTQDAVDEVAKALMPVIRKALSVRKSQGGQRVGSRGDEEYRVIKSLEARVARQDAVIAEMLEGFGMKLPAPPGPGVGRVEKSRGGQGVGRRDAEPMAGYDRGADLVDALAEAVVRKSQGGRPAGGQGAQDEFAMPVRKSLLEFTDSFGKMGQGIWLGRQ